MHFYISILFGIPIICYIYLHLMRKISITQFNKIVESIENVDVIVITSENESIESKYIVPINDSQKFVNILRENANTNKNLFLIIHCLGGSVIESDIIINSILRHNNPIYTFIPNYASSAATLIALATKKIYMDTYAFVSPTDPQITLDNGEVYSSKVLNEYLKLKIKSEDDNLILSALDAKVFHKDNIRTIKKIMKNKKISKKFINIISKGNYPHHYPIYSNELKKYGLNVCQCIPNCISLIFEKFILL